MLRDETHEHVLPVFAQCKFREQETHWTLNEALRSVDPGLLHHEKRNSTRPEPIPAVDADRRQLMTNALDDQRVIRVVTSGKACTSRRGVRAVQRGAVHDVEVVLDAEDNQRVFGAEMGGILNAQGSL